MPAPLQDFVDEQTTSAIRVALDPVQNVLRSLMLLSKYEQSSGLGIWVTETVAAMSEEELQVNQLVMEGLHYAVSPSEEWPAFPVYVDSISRTNPTRLRDKMMDFYDQMPVMEGVPAKEVINLEQAYESSENYLTFLRQRFQADHIDEELEQRAYQYVIDPPAMRQLIVDHLWRMWRKYAKAEWERVRPMLQETVRTYQQVDLRGMTFEQAYMMFTGREHIEEKWQSILKNAKRLVLVPQPHVGPYVLKGFCNFDTVYVFASPRLPQGMEYDVPDLSRAEIVVRLSALAEDTRLRIMRYIAERGELRSQEIMDVLDLSQSAASRHLSQLTATGLLKERRCDGAKCYSLNPERIHDTLHAVSNFLLVHERSEI